MLKFVSGSAGRSWPAVLLVFCVWRRADALSAAMAATLAAVTPAVGQQPTTTAAPPGDRWTVTLAPYLWLAAMDGHAVVGGIKSDVDVPVQDILKDLSFGAMLAIDLQKGRFGIGLNGLFARVSPDSKVGDVKIDVTSDSGQLAIAPFYRLIEWQYGVSSSGEPLRLVVAPEAGFRVTYMRTELDLHPGPTVDGSETWVDPLIGSRIGLDLTDTGRSPARPTSAASGSAPTSPGTPRRMSATRPPCSAGRPRSCSAIARSIRTITTAISNGT
jgi:hypothetical protein